MPKKGERPNHFGGEINASCSGQDQLPQKVGLIRAKSQGKGRGGGDIPRDQKSRRYMCRELSKEQPTLAKAKDPGG